MEHEFTWKRGALFALGCALMLTNGFVWSYSGVFAVMGAVAGIALAFGSLSAYVVDEDDLGDATAVERAFERDILSFESQTACEREKPMECWNVRCNLSGICCRTFKDAPTQIPHQGIEG